jgi:hypothetical protein
MISTSPTSFHSAYLSPYEKGASFTPGAGTGGNIGKLAPLVQAMLAPYTRFASWGLGPTLLAMEERPDQNGNYKCSDCGETYAKAISLEWHKDESAACRLIRARNIVEQQIRANQPLPQGPVVEEAPLADFDELPDFQILRIMTPRRSWKMMVLGSPMRRPQGSKFSTLASRWRPLSRGIT